MSDSSLEGSNKPVEILDKALFSPEDTFIAVCGVTGAGKSTFISKCCNEAESGIGHSLKSRNWKILFYSYCESQSNKKANKSIKETQEIKLYTFYFNKKRIHLIDTPGFDDTYRSDSQVLRDLAYWLSGSYGAGFKLTGIIYLHPITATRMNGTAFKNLRTFKKLCGKQSMSAVVLATTMWSNVTIEEGDNREIDLKNTEEFWGNMIREGSTIFRHDGGHHSAMNIVSHLLDKPNKTVLGLQTEMVDHSKSLDETEAGREVDSEMTKQREAYQRELESTKEEMREAIENNDKQHIEEVAREQERFQRKIAEIQDGREELKISMERLIKEKEEQHQKEKEAYKAALDAAHAEKLIVAGAAFEALKLQQEEIDARESKMQQEAKMRESRANAASAAERQRQQLRDQQIQRQQAEASFQQQQVEYAQQMHRMQMEQAAMWDQRQSSSLRSAMYSTASVGAGLAGSALNGMAAMSGCSVM